MVFVNFMVFIAMIILAVNLAIKNEIIESLERRNQFQRLMTVREILVILRDTENIQNQCEVFTTHDTNMREYISRKIADYERREKHIENELVDDDQSEN